MQNATVGYSSEYMFIGFMCVSVFCMKTVKMNMNFEYVVAYEKS